MDATTGARTEGAVRADVTITFGTMKHGLLAARDACGRVVVADIGLGAHAALDDEAALLTDAEVVRHVVPPVAWNAHKGTRGRVCIVGGTAGMAGAVQLAARGALASGAGLVRAMVHSLSAAALQSSVPAVVCVPAATPESLAETLAWAHAVLLGPGLGRDQSAHAQLQSVLEAVRDIGARDPTQHVHRGASHAVGFLAPTPPVLVLDADALVVASEAALWPLVRACAARTPVVLTPHAGEFARLAAACGTELDERATDPTRRLAAARHVAAASGAHVVMKGTPSWCVAPDGTAWCVARGTAALATGGTGDVLAGVLSALLAHARVLRLTSASQVCSLMAAAAWVHGAAVDDAPDTSRCTVRGRTVETLLEALPHTWARVAAPVPLPTGVLASLPDVRPVI
jgi:NAD(P)H-hydrate epimerase